MDESHRVAMPSSLNRLVYLVQEVYHVEPFIESSDFQSVLWVLNILFAIYPSYSLLILTDFILLWISGHMQSERSEVRLLFTGTATKLAPFAIKPDLVKGLIPPARGRELA